MDDPTSDTKTGFQSATDVVFLVIYTVEMCLKIFGFGFILNKGSYLRDYWNILDFAVVTTGYLPYFFNTTSGVNISSLRSMRILRPLKTITKIKELRNIMIGFFEALKPLLNSLIILLFFYTVFAIAGLQLF